MPGGDRDGGGLLVTGATGFVGRALVAALATGGHPAPRLRLLVRDPARAAEVLGPRGTPCKGRLEDLGSLVAAVRGSGAVVHLAGAVRALGPAGFFRANDRGTANLVRAIREAAPGARLVHVSSLAAAGPSADGRGSGLDPARCRPRSRYGESKRRGELHVQELSEAEARWAILRPPVVYGAGDLATRALLRQARWPVIPVPRPPRPLSLIHVDDLARAIVLALGAPVHGAVLPLEGPDRLDTSELMREAARACGRRPRLVELPAAAVRGAALVAELAARVRRRPAFFCVDKVRDLLAEGWVADPEPIREALGFVPEIGAREGLSRVAREEGLAPP